MQLLFYSKVRVIASKKLRNFTLHANSYLVLSSTRFSINVGGRSLTISLPFFKGEPYIIILTSSSIVRVRFHKNGADTCSIPPNQRLIAFPCYVVLWFVILYWCRTSPLPKRDVMERFLESVPSILLGSNPIIITAKVCRHVRMWLIPLR